jgi:hypothetical protein
MPGACRHCEKPLGRRCGAGRGLCWTCYRLPDVRAQYCRYVAGPRVGGGKRERPEEDEPTAEEIERMVAEQMANLPAWWDEEFERERDREYALKVYALVKCA